MCYCANALSEPKGLAELQSSFLTTILPQLQKYGRIAFRHFLDPDRKEDALAEMVALAWQWCLRLNRKGKDPTLFPTPLAVFAAKAVMAGRRLCGQDKKYEVLSPWAQRQQGFRVQTLPAENLGREDDPSLEALHDNTTTPPPEQAAFRIDFPAWVRTHTRRRRQIIRDLMMGERTGAISHKFGLSPGRISQMRRELMKDWERYTAVPEPKPKLGRLSA
jgi:hypothetical protein